MPLFSAQFVLENDTGLIILVMYLVKYIAEQ
jgi:hypothetical protein